MLRVEVDFRLGTLFRSESPTIKVFVFMIRKKSTKVSLIRGSTLKGTSKWVYTLDQEERI